MSVRVIMVPHQMYGAEAYQYFSEHKESRPWCTTNLSVKYIFNPRRACAARVTVLGPCVSLSVCLSVCLLSYIHSQTTAYETAHERTEY